MNSIQALELFNDLEAGVCSDDDMEASLLITNLCDSEVEEDDEICGDDLTDIGPENPVFVSIENTPQDTLQNTIRSLNRPKKRSRSVNTEALEVNYIQNENGFFLYFILYLKY